MRIAYNTLPFWSRFIIPADLKYDGTNCLRRIITKGTEIPVFDYRQGEAQARALALATATKRDTAQTEAGKTRGGARYRIGGISLTKDGHPYSLHPEDTEGLQHVYWPGMSQQPCNNGSGPLVASVEDYRSLLAIMTQILISNFYMTLQIDGVDGRCQMGPCCLTPGQGGEKSSIDAPNGDVFVANYMPIPELIDWNPAGASDSNMVINLVAAYDVWVPTWTTPAGTANGLPYDEQTNPKIEDAVPTALGRLWMQPWVINFHGQEQKPTSDVS